MKISSKTFNDYHLKELDRYIFNQKKCIHIMSDNTSHIEKFQKISRKGENIELRRQLIKEKLIIQLMLPVMMIL